MTLDSLFLCPKCQSNDHKEISQEFCIDDGKFYVKSLCSNCGYLYKYRFWFDFCLNEGEEN